MSDLEFKDIKAKLATLGKNPARFGLLRRAMRLAGRCPDKVTADPSVWRLLGERELQRHEKFSQLATAGGENAQWTPQIESSFSRAVAWLGRAADQGDAAALYDLGRLYFGDCGGQPSRARALHYFRKAARAGSVAALHGIHRALFDSGRADMALQWLRQAARRGHAESLVTLAELTCQGGLVLKDDAEAMRLLEDAAHFYATGRDENPAVRARIDFLHGVCLWSGTGVARDRDTGLMLIRRATGHHAPAAEWLAKHEARQDDPELSPMRFFAPGFRVKGMMASLDKTDAEILAPLDALIGLDSFKDDIARIVHLGKAQALRHMNGLKPVPLSLHMAFLGAPGTGKTTAARAVGKVLAETGLLRRGHLVEVDRSSLVGEYIGHTEAKTLAKIEQAAGGILFIDEAYALGNKDSARDFGNEAIEILVKAMEDKRDDLVVIAAGYTDQMNIFFAANPGLRSRFAHVMEFPMMKAEGAAALFRELCEQHQYRISAEVKDSIDRHFAQTARQASLHNANGRGVRTLFEQTIARQARRIVQGRLHDRRSLLTLLLEDLPWDSGKSRLHVVKD